MKFFIAVSLFVAAVSAGTFPGLLPRLPLIPASFSNELGSRITGGEEASLGQFPYQAALEIDDKYFCGGTVISDEYILTAAHCANGAGFINVILGATKINEKESQQVKLFVGKESITVHPGWNPSTLANDIALFRLPVALKFNDYIQKAILPKAGENFVGKQVVASGWGKDSDISNTVSPVLRYVESTVIPKTTCNTYYFGATPTDTVCMSGKNGKSTCNGDSGGPLVYKDSGKNIVIGATSFGIALGCEIGWPGVFTAVGAYLDWIEKVSGVPRA